MRHTALPFLKFQINDFEDNA